MRFTSITYSDSLYWDQSRRQGKTNISIKFINRASPHTPPNYWELFLFYFTHYMHSQSCKHYTLQDLISIGLTWRTSRRSPEPGLRVVMMMSV